MTNEHTNHMLTLMNDLTLALIAARDNDDLTAHADMLDARDALEFAAKLLTGDDDALPLALSLLNLAND